MNDTHHAGRAPRAPLFGLVATLCFSSLLALSACDGGSPEPPSSGAEAGELTPLAGDDVTAGASTHEPPPPPPPPPAVCGDHVIEGDEECDDGNFEAGDGCDPSCLIERCGNGVLQFGERCDEGELNSDERADACRSNCTPARCGDGVRDRAEQCDDGNLNELDACRPSCVLARCGDGLLRADVSEGEPGFEACDEGELNSDSQPNACRANCALPRCGDGVRDAGEECDLGDDNSSEPGSGARCRADCRTPRCGDGVSDERAECQSQPLDPPPLCGNGLIDEGEECDLGEANSDDPSEQAEPSDPPSCRTSCVLARCGDGVRDAGEQCDDGNLTLERCAYGEEACEVCSPTCALLAGAVAFCGDGVLDARELCDDGNQEDGDGCDASCRPEGLSCGDGVLDPGEDCDDGNSRDGDGCDFECRSECGNGALDLGEECDAGPLNQQGRCDDACSLGRYLITQGEHTHHGALPLPQFDESGEVINNPNDLTRLNRDELLLQVDGPSTLSICLSLVGQEALPPRALSVQAVWLLSAGEGDTLSEDNIERVSASLTPSLALNAEGNSSGCARFELNPLDEPELSEGRGVLRVHVGLHNPLSELSVLAEPLRSALTASGALHQGGRALRYRADLTLTRPLSLSTAPSLDLTGRVHPQGDDLYSLTLAQDSLVTLRLSADGLGACPQKSTEGLTRPRLEVYQALSEGAGESESEGRGALFAQERSRAPLSEPHAFLESCSLLSSTQPWPAGRYVVRVTGERPELPTSHYTLNARLHRQCSSDEPSCEALTPTQASTTWVKSAGRWRAQLGELSDTHATQTPQALTEAGAMYRFEVSASGLGVSQGLKTHLQAHLEGCAEGSAARLSLWRLERNAVGGETARFLQQASLSSPAERAEGAPCQHLSAELTPGVYAMSVRHPTLSELEADPQWLASPSSSTLSSLEELSARATLPYELSAVRFITLNGGAQLTNALQLTPSPTTLGDALIALNLKEAERVDLWFEPREAGGCTFTGSNNPLTTFNALTTLSLSPLEGSTPLEVTHQGVSLSDESALEAMGVTALAPPSALTPRSTAPCAHAYSLMIPAGEHLLWTALSDEGVGELEGVGEEQALHYALTLSLPLRCGDGVIEGIEACDDGNRLNGDYCDARCQRTAVCGDGVLESRLGERCDDGNLTPFDGCSPECARCGDGVVEGSEACEPEEGSEGCDAYCTLTQLTTPQASWRSGPEAISAGERDRVNVTLLPSAWLSAQTYGCEPEVAGAPRRFDTTLALYNDADQLLASGDDLNATSACSGVQAFIETAGTGYLSVESERFNDIVGYELSVEQHVKLALDADGLCVVTPDPTQPTLSPRAQCEAAGARELNYEASLSRAEADTHVFKLNTKRDAFMQWTLTRPNAQTPCPVSAWVSGFYDEARLPVRVDLTLTPADELGEGLTCGFLSARLWPAGRYELRLSSQAEPSPEAERAPYTLHAQLEEPVCGNGYLEVGEVCDLGTLNSDSAPGRQGGGDVCRTTCVFPSCGDGVRDREEACDSGPLNSDEPLTVGSAAWLDPSPRCRPSCELSFCGDGIIDGGEGCDEGSANLPSSACLPSCQPAACGDGFIQLSVEVCDDGNVTSGDGCDATCQPEQRCPSGVFIPQGQACPPLPETPVCGDGAVTTPEGCDDGNLINNDGCDATCQPERVLIHTALWSTDELTTRGLHLYELEVQAPSRVVILTAPSTNAEGTSRCRDGEQGSVDLDTTLTLYLLNPETGLIEQRVNSNDDATEGDRCAAIEQTLYQPGRYLIEVGAFGGEPLLAPYKLSVQRSRDLLTEGQAQGSLRAGESHAYEVTLYDHLKRRFSFMSSQLSQLNVSFKELPLNASIATQNDLPLERVSSTEVRVDLDSGLSPAEDPFTQRPQPERAPLKRGLLLVSRPANAGEVPLSYTLTHLRPCGDGLISRVTITDQDNINISVGEECDDGNTQDGDGCSAWCRIERGVCGNGIREEGEACDPGHLISDPYLSRTFYDPSAEPSSHEMSATTLIYFNSDEAPQDIELIIDTTQMNLDDLPLELRARVAFTRLNDESNLRGVARRITQRFEGLIQAWAQGDQLSLITYGGLQSSQLSISTPALSPWLITPSQPLCDTSCTLTRQRLVGTHPSQDPTYRESIFGATSEGERDELYFSLDVPHSFKASTEGCRFESATEMAVDTQLTLYRLQKGVISAEVASADDRSEPNASQAESASALCAQLNLPTLPAGDYVLHVEGYLQDALEAYTLNFSLSRELGELEGSLMSGVSQLIYDEFSEQRSRDHYSVAVAQGQTRFFSVELISGDTCTTQNGEIFSELSLEGADQLTCTTLNNGGYQAEALLGHVNNTEVSVGATGESEEPVYRFKYCANADCAAVSCGNGIIDTDDPTDDQPLEECDDGNNIDDDGCTNSCRINKYDVTHNTFTLNNLESVEHEIFFPLGDDQTIAFRIPSSSNNTPRYAYLFNKRYDAVRVSSNGLIGLLNNTGMSPSRNLEEPAPLGEGRSFSTYTGNGCCSGRPIPSAASNEPIIAVFWEDLLGIGLNGSASDFGSDASGNSVALLTEAVDHEEDREWLVIEWRGVSHYGSFAGDLHMQALIRIFAEDESTSEEDVQDHQENATIKLRCLSCASDGGAHTQGLQGHLPYQGESFGRSAYSWSVFNDEVTFTPHARPSP